MNNPWLKIPLGDYESHITLPIVSQGEMMAGEFSDVVQQFKPDSVAVIGCAGGNGFDRLPASVRRVVGVDINPTYIESTSNRYREKVNGLELYVADIQAEPLQFEPVDLIYVALVFEYVSVAAALKNLSEVCKPGGHLVALLQQPSAVLQTITPSPYKSIQTLVPLAKLIPSTEMVASASSYGFVIESEKKLTLDSGKEFAVQVYRRLAD